MDRGYLTLEQLDEALNDYKQNCGLSENQWRALQEGDVDQIVDLFADFGRSPRLRVYRDYVALFLRNIIRFIDTGPRLEKNRVAGEYGRRENRLP